MRPVCRLPISGLGHQRTERPRNVLLMQIHRDLCEAAAWYPPEEFVAHVLQNIRHAGESRYPELTTKHTGFRIALRLQGTGELKGYG